MDERDCMLMSFPLHMGKFVRIRRVIREKMKVEKGGREQSWSYSGRWRARLDGQFDFNRRALSAFAFDAKRAAMQLDQVLDDG